MFPPTMTAAILAELHTPLVVEEVELPSLLQSGQVVVKVHYSGICGSQIGEIDGVKGADRFLPHLLGHEGSGTVSEIGPGVRHVKVGDKVVLHWRRGMGIEADTPCYRWRNNPLNAGWVTTFNDYAIVSENRVTAVSKDTDMQIAALFGCAVTTGFGVIQNDAKVRIGHSVAICGAGGIGLSVVQACTLVGAYPIIAIDIHDNRLELARKLGATHVVNANERNMEAEIRHVCGASGVDNFIDNTGLPENIQTGYRATAQRGRVTLVGVPKAGADISIHTLPLHFGKVLSGSHGGEALPHEDIPRYMRMLKAGRFSLDQLITKVYNLAEINDAIDDMRSGRAAGRCLVRLNS